MVSVTHNKLMTSEKINSFNTRQLITTSVWILFFRTVEFRNLMYFSHITIKIDLTGLFVYDKCITKFNQINERNPENLVIGTEQYTNTC